MSEDQTQPEEPKLPIETFMEAIEGVRQIAVECEQIAVAHTLSMILCTGELLVMMDKLQRAKLQPILED
jgi:hypothetical protein